MIAVDVETTGTNPSVHSILAIGAIDFENPTNQFYGECRAFDGAHMEPEALTINGLTEGQARSPGWQREEDLVKSFIAWTAYIRDWTFVGQNPAFDRSFIESACARYHLAYPFPHRSIDTHSLCYAHMVAHGSTPPFDARHHHSAINLDYILSYCGVPAEPKPHNALTGALCHAEVASRLLYDKSLMPEFSVYEIPWQAKKVG
jgi:DNA polymerase III epsilon subunit-like protein